MHRIALVAVASAVILAGCQTAKRVMNVAKLGVDFSWANTTACSGKPPAFNITGVPKGTKTLKFWMTDLDVPGYTHGGGDVAFKGSGSIPAGAFGYGGPCPPSGSHSYEFAVTAIGADGTIIGEGKKMNKFPP
jgi:phosphatidylethanolamine-binding protein (PEBP) family uncharacterized protein